MVMQTSPAPQRQSTGKVLQQEAVASAPEANTAVEQAEEEAVNGADDALDSAPEIDDDDADLVFDEEVGTHVVTRLPSCEGILCNAYTSCEFVFRHAVTPDMCVCMCVGSACYFTMWYRSLSKQILFVCFRETRMKTYFMRTLTMKRPCGSLRR